MDAGQQGFSPPPQTNWRQPPRLWKSFGSGWRAALFGALGLAVVSVVVAVIVVVSNFGNPFSPAQLQTVDGVNGLLTRMRSQFGDTTGYSLIVFRDHADVERADPTDQHRLRRYAHSSGNWSEHRGGSVSSFDALADLSRFDAAAVLTTLQGAAKSLGLTNPGDPYLTVRGVTGGELNVSIHVSDHGINGYVEVNPDGSVEELHPPS